MYASTPRLPDRWSPPEVVSDVVVADGVELHRAGVSSIGPSGDEVLGAAVEHRASPLARSYFELLERASTIEALHAAAPKHALLDADGAVVGERRAQDLFPESPEPGRWRYARSNGVALHDSWETATSRAVWELAERDRVLSAWYGDTRPQPMTFDVAATPLVTAASYAWSAFVFPPSEADFAREAQVVGLFGIPRRDDAPVVSGYGARPALADALDAAVREALQQLGFLWGEPVAVSHPEATPTPLAHIDSIQWPGGRRALCRWLEAGHERFRSPRQRASRDPAVSFVDLTPAWLPSGLRVAKAVCDAAVPLAFGESPYAVHLPPELRLHPLG